MKDNHHSYGVRSSYLQPMCHRQLSLPQKIAVCILLHSQHLAGVKLAVKDIFIFRSSKFDPTLLLFLLTQSRKAMLGSQLISGDHKSLQHMGSRITRAVFKDERSRPIDKNRAEDIANLTTNFFSFIACLFFFLFGYLYRPYLQQQPSLYLTAILLLVATKKIPPASKTIVLSLLVFVLIVVAHIVGLECYFLKASLILSAVLFASLSNSDLVGNPFRHSLLLWAQYEFLRLGLSLSQDIQKINLSSGRPAGEDSMFVKCLFSLIGMMGFTLTSFGKSYLRKHLEKCNKEIGLKQQAVWATLGFMLLLCFFAVKSAIAVSFTLRVGSVLGSLALLFGLRRFRLEHTIWVIALSLTFCIHFIDFLAQGQNSISAALSTCKILVINLVCVDVVRLWSRSMVTGSQKPYLSVLVYFTAIYLTLLCRTTSTLLASMPVLLQVGGWMSYGVMVGWDYYQRRNYELLP